MNQRERVLVIALVSLLVVVGGGFFVYRLYWLPLQERHAAIAKLEDEIKSRRDRIELVKANRPKLERWKQISLPADVDLSRREYEKFLEETFRTSGFQTGSFRIDAREPDVKSAPQLPGKIPVYTKLDFTVQSHADLPSLVKMMEKFYRAPLLHQIKKINIQKPQTASQGQRTNDLDINLTFEAIILNGAEKRANLLPVDRRLVSANLGLMTSPTRGTPAVAAALAAALPSGPFGPGHLAQPPREYLSIPVKNIFYGPPPRQERPQREVEVTRYVYLTDITENSGKIEGWLWDRYNNQNTRLRSSTGFNTFKIRDSNGETLVEGKIVRMADRDVLFKVDDKYYNLHVGQNLDDALRKPVATAEKLGLFFEAVEGGW